MPSPPKNRTVGQGGVKSCLVAISRFLGTELQHAVEGDRDNGSIYVENPPDNPISVQLAGGGSLTVENEPQLATSKGGASGIIGGGIQGFVNIPLDGLYAYDFTLYIRFDAGTSTPKPVLSKISCIPLESTSPPSGITLQPVEKTVNLNDNEGAVFFGPNLDQQNQGAISHCRAIRLGFERDYAALGSSTIYYELVYTRRS